MGTCCGDSKDKKDKNGRLYCSAEETTVTSVTKKFGNACCEMPRGALRYVGERYITKFADPIQWDANRAYEQIEAVQHEGFTYISKQPVPAGVQIDNEEFWLLWADPNAQMEQLRQYVETFDGRITENTDDIEQLSDEVESLLIETNVKTCVLFGDSYLRTYSGANYENPGWGDVFLESTGFNQVGRFKSGGAGWVVNGTSDAEAGLNFLGMLEKAYTAINKETREKVDYVVCQGVINDLLQNIPIATIIQNVHTFCNKARAYFPNAKIVISTAVCSEAVQNDKRVFQLYRDLTGILRGGAVYASNSIYWFRQLVDKYGRGDDVHPNPNGYTYLGRLIARVAMGEADCYHPFYYASGWLRTLCTEANEQARNFATIETRTSFVNGVVSGYIREAIVDHTLITSDTWVKLPFFAFEDTEAIIWLPVMAQIPSTGQGAIVHNALRVKDGYLWWNMRPAIRNYSGQLIEYENNMQIRFNFVFPMGGY